MLLVLAGCGPSRTDDGAVTEVVFPPAAAREAFDPPADFGPRTGEMGRGTGDIPIVEVLDGVHGWLLGAKGLVRVDLTTGEVHEGLFPDHAPSPEVDLDRVNTGFSTADPTGPPVVADTPVGRLALAAFPIKIPDRGTSPGGIGVELVAADSSTGQKTQSTLIPLPGSQAPGAWPRFEYVGVIGVHGATAVVTAHTSEYAFTAAVDLASRRVLWTAPDRAGQMIVGDTVIVAASDRSAGRWDTRGLSIADGRQRWVSTSTGTAHRVGRDMLLLDGSSTSVVLNATTGQPAPAVPLHGARRGWSCFHDQRTVTVCQRGGGRSVEILLGLDDSGTELWRIVNQTGGRRVPPAVSAVWHGAIYGYTRDGVPVVLDARTGADRTPAASIAPFLVNEYFGIAAVGSPMERMSGASGQAVAAPATS
ncbi:hypothetical protein [Pseudonocardia sp. ICBG1293]|uniref:hypothetical protein n=1 Tax=Pseudonocardia sp. ICBG1293 TaxID=2844382 RepID=UPI001CCAE251|nr:hypothetical protein [Pseudonocardia sp. ICBG1293]